MSAEQPEAGYTDLIKVIYDVVGRIGARIIVCGGVFIVALMNQQRILEELAWSYNTFVTSIPNYAFVSTGLSIVAAGTLLGLYLRLRRKRPIKPLAAPLVARAAPRVLSALQPSPMPRPLSDEVPPEVMQRFFPNR